ncbi:MAG: nickel pincer cofactor biosynthesis protein LarC [Candidatus Helarchaeota archaeon]
MNKTMDELPNQKVIILDCQIAGISGDMLLGGLVDLGADFQIIKKKLLQSLKPFYNIEKITINCKKVVKNGISATQLIVKYPEEKEHKHGGTLKSILEKILKPLSWKENEKLLAINILKTLIKAEAKIHGSSIDKVHLHEAGSIDTIIDIVGFILACKNLNILQHTSWISTPVAVGGGILNFSHGKISIPAPAVLEILKNKRIEIKGGPIQSELTTPTGAAILVNLISHSSEFYPKLKIERVGYGGGKKNFQSIPNVLRIVKGIKSLFRYYQYEEIVTIETNVDDVTGELIGNTINKLVNNRMVLDAAVIPMTTKKRPGYIIKILAYKEHIFSIVQHLINELGTLGVRFFPTKRYRVNRKIISLPIQIHNQIYHFPVKISWDSKNTVIQTKPESDKVLLLSEQIGISMRELLRIIANELDKKYPIGKSLPE